MAYRQSETSNGIVFNQMLGKWVVDRVDHVIIDIYCVFLVQKFKSHFQMKKKKLGNFMKINRIGYYPNIKYTFTVVWMAHYIHTHKIKRKIKLNSSDIKITFDSIWYQKDLSFVLWLHFVFLLSRFYPIRCSYPANVFVLLYEFYNYGFCTVVFCFVCFVVGKVKSGIGEWKCENL